MSYILDALKKAESERERGLVPGVHAQPISNSRSARASATSARSALLAIAAVALAVVVLGALWWRSQTGSTHEPVRVAIQPATPISRVTSSPSVTAAMPAEATEPATAQPPTASPPAAVTVQPTLTPAPTQGSVMAPAQITPQPAAMADPNASTTRRPSPALASAGTSKKDAIKIESKTQIKSVPSTALPPALAASSTTSVAAAPTQAPSKPETSTRVAVPAVAQSREPIGKLSELPADARLAVPKLVVSGSTYSETPAYRMLIINGQVFHEGEKIAPDMVLQQIRPSIAVLEYKGQRYSMPY